ncbi:hypothetical protein [Deinococcus navajonensis]|uniref:Urease accessory protein UreD n=1 Tax=Deinococcus navajonensis TaxID=309884 RepID=A0ABV8XHC5_9DEIO
MSKHPLRHLIADLSAQPQSYRLSTSTGAVNLQQPPESVGWTDVFTLSGPAGSEQFVINGPRAYGRGGSFDLNAPADRYLLTQTVQATTPSHDEHLGLHPELDEAGFTLSCSQPYLHQTETLTLLTARHPSGRVLWFSELQRQPFGLPLEHYVQYSGLRLAALRHHEPRHIVSLMAESDEALCARGVAPHTLPPLLLVSAWPVRREALQAILDGEHPEAAVLLPGDFEWHPTAYQQLHLSLTRGELQAQAGTSPLAHPA